VAQILALKSRNCFEIKQVPANLFVISGPEKSSVHSRSAIYHYMKFVKYENSM